LAGAAAGASASIGILRWPGEAAQFSYKLANDQAPTHPINTAAAAAVKRILDGTGGQLEIRLFPNSALGGDPQMIAQTRSGAIELLLIGNNILSGVVQAAALESLPFAFPNSKALISAANGPLGAYMNAQAAKVGLRPFSRAFYGGAFHVENRLRPINVPEDLKGLKVRVPPGPIDVATFKAFEASPTVISLAEVYTSLQTHLVDGIEVPLPVLQFFKFFEQVSYCSLTSHSYITYNLFANQGAWNALPANVQAVVDKEFAAAGDAASNDMATQEGSMQQQLSSEGVTFNRPAIEPFRKVIRASGLYATLRDQSDPAAWSALERTTGKLV
jgi:tripartite ATP-independent transporter DctP family solute receptor